MGSSGPSTDPRKRTSPETGTPGHPRAVLRVLEPSALSALLEPRPGELRIGRDPECDIRVGDSLCSRFHARLVVSSAPRPGGRPLSVVEDLGSTNGTWVNNERLRRPRALRPHDKLRIGETLFAYLLLDELELSAMQRIVQAAMTDALTGLSNRWTFEQELARELVRARRYQWPLALLMVDLDRFKSINDRYGHAGGDEVLRAVAGVILAGKRGADLAGRHGGEELVLALPQTDGAAALVVAERLRTAIGALRLRLGEHDGVRVTASVGVAVQPPGETDIGALYAAADAAMYRAKAAGRDCSVWLRLPGVGPTGTR